MILNGVDYGRAWCASGALNFFGEGWPHHKLLGPFGVDFTGATFVAKTTTFNPREGNMPLTETTPREWLPQCIKVNVPHAAVLNAVGLSGPGVNALLADGRWQARTEPFVISYMATNPSGIFGRCNEAATFAVALAAARPSFCAKFAIEINLSCPNTGLDTEHLVCEGRQILDTIAARLPDVPLIPKLNVMVPHETAAALAVHKHCAALCVSNTIPWGALPDRIDWAKLFGATSPLAVLGGGGLSGAPITQVVREWVKDFLDHYNIPLIAGGGVMTPGDARTLLNIGAQAVEIGSVAIVRPWRVQSIVKAINDWRR